MKNKENNNNNKEKIKAKRCGMENLCEKDISHKKQLQMINQLFFGDNFEYKVMIEKEIERRWQGYKQQDIKKVESNKWKCHRFDFLCKVSGKGAANKKNNSIAKEINKQEDIQRVESLGYSNDEKTEISLYAGMFDFSDTKQSSGLFGFQHLNEELYRESFLGKLTPITGGWITQNNSVYLYTGAQAEYDMGLFTFKPSFAPGYYNTGDGKDLGSPLEFKTEVQMSLNLPKDSEFGLRYNHISNASLGDKNPGANSYMLNFLKRF